MDEERSNQLVFISHSEKDWKLAAAFGNLVQSASKDTLKPYFTSDRTGAAGPTFGKQWLKSIQASLASARCLVTLITVNSIDRPWILYENGIARGLDKNLYYILCGVGLRTFRRSPLGICQHTRCTAKAIQTLMKTIVSKDIAEGAEIEEEVSKFIAEAERSIPSGRCDSMSELQLMRHLLSTYPLKGEECAREKLYNSKNYCTKYFMRHYWRLYKKALQKFPRQSLALPSEPRMEAAIEAIREAQDVIKAISIVNQDQWHLAGNSVYHQENLKKSRNNRAAKGKLKMQRLFVFDEQRSVDKHFDIMKQQKDAGIEVSYILSMHLQEYFTNTHREDAPFVNLLIADSVMTLSNSHSNHGGKLVVETDDIAIALNRFDHAWHISTQLS